VRSGRRQCGAHFDAPGASKRAIDSPLSITLDDAKRMDSTIAAAGLGERAPAAAAMPGRIAVRDFVPIAVQLGLVLVLLRQFQIESTAFVQFAAIAFAGVFVHAFLPHRLRLPFFAAVCVLSLPIVLGVANGAWLIAIGLTLIGICHLPISARARAVALLAIGALLAAQRAKLVPFPWPEAIWPILGSMFMFRMIVYFYDLRHDKVPVTPAQAAGYFFMLPNACFPLFPVVDFKTYRRSHYSADAYRTYQKGIDWLVRGVVHLILYRYIYYHVTLAPSEVTGPAELMQYLVSNFLLYLRVSGLFHMVVGMLYLYGFHLPETHNRYLLASSFTDFWRRINIYWKDFMQKVFYFPAVFALKRYGTTLAITVATLYVFLLTWALHSYQWFWLRGSVLFAWQDILFWAVLGLLVVANSLYEIKYGRSRSLGKPVWTWKRGALVVAKTYATFWAICILWSLWTSESLADWLSLWSALKGRYTMEVLLFPGLILAVVALGSIPQQKAELAKTPVDARRVWWRDRIVTLGSLALLIVVSIESVHTKLGTETATLVNSLRSGHLSRLDNAKLERGYYEGLLSVDRFNSQLWEVYSKKPSNWLEVENAGLKRFVGGFAQVELIPSFVSSTKYGTISINRFGMRDRDYADVPPPGTFRAAVLGASSVMGWGVGDAGTFEALVEERLGREPLSPAFQRVELLNYGVPGYQPPQQLVAFEKSLRLQPSAVFYIATGRELRRSADYMAEVVRKRIAIPYDGLRAIVEKSGARSDMDQATALRHLEPYGGEILQWVYNYIGQRSRERGMRAVWVFLPQVREGSWQEETPAAVRAAQAAGFVVVNLEDVYKGRDIATIRLAEWDDHPNALGHQLVADRLYAALAANRDAIFGADPAARRAPLASNPQESAR
jgi:alginate O-acetyltransferase complex protein AlgI